MTEQQSTEQRQEALELEATTLGVHRYMKEQAKSLVADTAPGKQLLKRSVDSTSVVILNFIEAANTGKAGKRHSAVKWLKDIDSNVLAYITAAVALNTASVKEMRLARVALMITTAIEDHINYCKMESTDKGLYIKLQRQLSKSTSARHRRGVMSHALEEYTEDRFAFPEQDRMHLGLKLLECFVEATGLMTVVMETKHTKRALTLHGTPELSAWLDNAHETLSLMRPVHHPMLVKPKAWTPEEAGGYLYSLAGKSPLVRTRNKAYLRELKQADMPMVYESLNAMQDTAWRINNSVLAVMQEAWEGGGGIGELPHREKAELPTLPQGLQDHGDLYKVEHPEEFKKWKRERAIVYEENARSTSQRVAAAYKLSMADKFKDEPAIYFPHNLDFRGRAYPIASILTPQGDDAAKALLQFSSGFALGDRGAFWLAVHLANCFGVDKVPFADRLAWVTKNEEAIFDSAMNPLDGSRLWETADSPWCALAACMEWLGYKMTGESYVSHLPIALDGSCNGLQNFSAMLRDSIGGSATNLLPCDVPADIYMRVLEVANLQIKADAEMGKPEAIRWDGRLTRDDVKRPVMTLPYGVTKSGMRAQIEEKIKKREGCESSDAFYIAEVLWNCIGQVVVAAREAMDWLKEAARVAASSDLPVSWTTPAGFPVLQEYRVEASKTLSVHFGGRRMDITRVNSTLKLDRRRQALGISPNFVHSCDASHMMLSVVIAKDNGIDSFAMIHDSYATHAAHTDVLAASLRQAFVDQYTPNVLEVFCKELEEQLEVTEAAKLPPLPPTGNLELSSVLESKYFFA